MKLFSIFIANISMRIVLQIDEKEIFKKIVTEINLLGSSVCRES